MENPKYQELAYEDMDENDLVENVQPVTNSKERLARQQAFLQARHAIQEEKEPCLTVENLGRHLIKLNTFNASKAPQYDKRYGIESNLNVNDLVRLHKYLLTSYVLETIQNEVEQARTKQRPICVNFIKAFLVKAAAANQYIENNTYRGDLLFFPPCNLSRSDIELREERCRKNWNTDFFNQVLEHQNDPNKIKEIAHQKIPEKVSSGSFFGAIGLAKSGLNQIFLDLYTAIDQDSQVKNTFLKTR